MKFKVKCVECKSYEHHFTVGKVYEWDNNTLVCDSGYRYFALVDGENPDAWELNRWYKFEKVEDESEYWDKLSKTLETTTETLVKLAETMKEVVEAAKGVAQKQVEVPTESCISDEEIEDMEKANKICKENLYCHGCPYVNVRNCRRHKTEQTLKLIKKYKALVKEKTDDHPRDEKRD